MTRLTDEQIEAALDAYRDALLVKTGAGIHWSLDREIAAMRAALHTLGPISVHREIPLDHPLVDVSVCEHCVTFEHSPLISDTGTVLCFDALWPCSFFLNHYAEREAHA